MKAAGSIGLAAPQLVAANGARHGQGLGAVTGASAFGWLAPGELRLFELSQSDEAKKWIGQTSSG